MPSRRAFLRPFAGLTLNPADAGVSESFPTPASAALVPPSHQEFTPKDRGVLNGGEVLGPVVALGARGTYELAPGFSGRTPARVTARITGGWVDLFGRRVALPIQGQGDFEVLYVDDKIRVFRSPATGALSVQVPEALLPGDELGLS